MKKVLITGGAGFIGANAARAFLALGNQIIVAEKEGADLWRLDEIKDKITIRFTDLTNAGEIEKFVAEIKPNIVLHFATYGAYQRFQQDIATTIDVNLKGTINLLHACQKVGVEAFINTGSNSEYGIKKTPMKETDILEADNLYGITKGAVTMYCQMMARKFGFPVVIIRPFAVYGPFEEKGRLIPEIITAYAKNEAPKLSSPDSVRDFIFIEDLMEGYLAVIKHIEKIKGEIFNLGSGKQTSIQEVVSVVKEITNASIEPNYGTLEKAQTEPKTWVADISKAKKMLDWEPKHTLEEGLAKNIEWFKKNLARYE